MIRSQTSEIKGVPFLSIKDVPFLARVGRVYLGTSFFFRFKCTRGKGASLNQRCSFLGAYTCVREVSR